MSHIKRLKNLKKELIKWIFKLVSKKPTWSLVIMKKMAKVKIKFFLRPFDHPNQINDGLSELCVALNY